MPELLTRIDIRDMHFNDGRRNCCDGIVDRYGGVGIGTSVKDDAIKFKTNLLYDIDNLALNVRLKIMKLNLWKTLDQRLKKRFKALSPIDMGFTFSQKVQVWAIDNLNSHRRQLKKSLCKCR